ncbi:MAG: discoidin domain-containing protein, partial [Dolichospermum sp.]
STSWNSGNFASQWIEVDLGQEYHLYSIQLLIEQQPGGSTTHEVWVSNQSISNSYTGATLAKTFQGFTDTGQWLESDFSNSTKERYVQVKTVSSPSWIAWVEIQIFGELLDLPTITLAVSPSSVTEDGTTNLVYTFTRTGSTTNALTVNYSITGTANTSDYTGATPGTGKTITFAAGASTATLTIDPTADTIVESDETVALTLAAGTGYTVGTTAAVTGTITNDDLLPNLNLSANQTIVEGNTNPQNVTYTVTLSNA